MKDSSKKTIVTMLDVWFEFNGISWKKPKYSGDSEIPYIPTEAELDQFIACLGRKTAIFCQLLKDTGARCGEISALRWKDIDFGQRKIRIKAEKHSNGRVLPLSAKTIDMLCNLPRNTERLFAGCSGLRSNFFLQRRRKAQQLANPNLLLIHFHTFRHWKATMEQHKTKDPWHVKMILGHKSIQSTETYIHLEKMLYEGADNDQFVVKVADTMDDAIKLMEVGFEYHAEVEGHKLFRKRK
jgi:integrase